MPETKRKTTTPEDTMVELPKGKLINGRFHIVRKLGEGGCGVVYEVLDQSSNMRAALKVEANNVPGGSVLKIEVEVLKQLRSCKFVARLIHSGKRSTYSYVVMTLLGPSLQYLWRNRCAGRPLSESTAVRIGIQTLFGIKQLHDIGFIHRDIKPANLAMGLGDGVDSRFIHLLDFGLSRVYAVSDASGKQTIRPPRPEGQLLFRGTFRYCSLNALLRKEQSRHDDLWSLMYMLIEISGGLPWSKVSRRGAVFDKVSKLPDSVEGDRPRESKAGQAEHARLAAAQEPPRRDVRDSGSPAHTRLYATTELCVHVQPAVRHHAPQAV